MPGRFAVSAYYYYFWDFIRCSYGNGSLFSPYSWLAVSGGIDVSTYYYYLWIFIGLAVMVMGRSSLLLLACSVRGN